MPGRARCSASSSRSASARSRLREARKSPSISGLLSASVADQPSLDCLGAALVTGESPRICQQPCGLHQGPGGVGTLEHADGLAGLDAREPAAALEDQRRRVVRHECQCLADAGHRASEVPLVPEEQRRLHHHPGDGLRVTPAAARLDRPGIETLRPGDVAHDPPQMGCASVGREPRFQIQQTLARVDRGPEDLPAPAPRPTGSPAPGDLRGRGSGGHGPARARRRSHAG